MPGGQKPKRGQPNCNISELQNHPKPSPAPSKHSRHTTPAQSQAPSPDYDDEDDADLDLLVHWDSQKTQYVNDPEDKGEGEVVDDDGDEELQEWEGFGKEELLDVMIGIFEDDDEGNLDWLPPKLAEKCKKRQENKKGKHSPEICRFEKCEKQGPKHMQRGQMSCPKHFALNIVMQSHSKHKQSSQGSVISPFVSNQCLAKENPARCCCWYTKC